MDVAEGLIWMCVIVSAGGIVIIASVAWFASPLNGTAIPAQAKRHEATEYD
jgi:hypothetical protein